MTGDPFKKVQPGDPLRIQAETFNTFIDAAIAHRSRSHDLAHDVARGASDADIVLIKNVLSEPLSRFSVVGLGESVVLPSENLAEFKNQVAFEAVTPATDRIGRFAVLAEPIPPGVIGKGVVSGVTPVRILVQNELDTHAELGDTTEYLKSTLDGSAVILWLAEVDPEHPDDPRWAIVRLSNRTMVDLLVEITESDPYQTLDDGSALRPIAIHREMSGYDRQEIECVVLRADDCGEFLRTDRVIQVNKHLLHGVHWTGRKVWVRYVGKCYQIVTPGTYLWGFAVAQESIASGAYGEVELFADGPIVSAFSETSIAEGTACKVLFDDEDQKFVIFAQACPPPPPEGS